jgi:hypothetical protein
MGHGTPGSSQRRLDHGLEVKYAWSPAVKGDYEKWTLEPWRLKGLKTFDLIEDIPEDHVLVVSHFAPWWSPLKEWIAAGRPWIEIEFGYWGDNEPRRNTRRVTYCGHHNLNVQTRPWPRSQLFNEPRAMYNWRATPGQYIVIPKPIKEILQQRTGEDIVEWCNKMESLVRTHWDGEIVWRSKGSSKPGRWNSFVRLLDDAHAVVGDRTMACVEACLLGVPAYTIDHSMTTLLMGGVENLGNIQHPDRSDWWDHICWSQFHIWEFTDCGESVADLVESYQIHR